MEVLQLWDSGFLLTDMRKTIAEFGHGRLQNLVGDTLDIGGSTGGGSRRIIDNWVPPNWRDFLFDPEQKVIW